MVETSFIRLEKTDIDRYRGSVAKKKGDFLLEKSVLLASVVCLLLTLLSGCTAPLALPGLNGTTPVAFNSTGSGKGDSSWHARYDEVVQATLRAGQALSLKLENKEIGKDQTVFKYSDEKGKKLGVLIERRTETVTYARFSVGLFGSRAIGHLMVRQIIFEMEEEGKFLRDWHPAETD